MGEIRIVSPGKTRGYPYPVCKERMFSPGKTRGYTYSVCKKRMFSTGKTRGYPDPVCKKRIFSPGKTCGTAVLIRCARKERNILMSRLSSEHNDRNN